MRKVAALASAISCLVAFACAPPPALREYAYPAWGFAASFRAPPKETDTPASPDGKSAHTFLVEGGAGGRDNLVYVIDGSSSTKSDDQALTDAPGALAKSVGGTLGPITYASSGTVMGREFLLNRHGRPASKVRIFVAGKHLYEVISQSPLGPDDSETAEFLASFRLLAAR
ncbi:MAG: hypothetical protein JO127_09710 [Caulobacteraceae bacterium]|nr:hypothetical protein [Caulobacteraceae bacterium]